jgi:hypothetical protein
VTPLTIMPSLSRHYHSLHIGFDRPNRVIAIRSLAHDSDIRPSAILSAFSSTGYDAGEIVAVSMLPESQRLFLQMFCNRVLLTNSDIEIFMTPDFEDATTIFQDAEIVPLAGFAPLCVDRLTRYLASDSVRCAMLARCQATMLDNACRAVNAEQTSASNICRCRQGGWWKGRSYFVYIKRCEHGSSG